MIGTAGSCTASAQEQQARHGARWVRAVQYPLNTGAGVWLGHARPPVPPARHTTGRTPHASPVPAAAAHARSRRFPQPPRRATAPGVPRAVRSVPCRPHGRTSFSALFACYRLVRFRLVVRCARGQLARLFPLHATPLALPAFLPLPPARACRSPSSDRRLAGVTVRPLAIEICRILFAAARVEHACGLCTLRTACISCGAKASSSPHVQKKKRRPSRLAATPPRKIPSC
jgi:hypothetical protein